MKKRILLIALLFCSVLAQAQDVFVTADFVSSYIWRGMDSGNASVQPSLGGQLERTDRLRLGVDRISP